MVPGFHAAAEIEEHPMALTTWTIEADDRERAGGVPGGLASYPQVVVAVGRLPRGDYRPGGGLAPGDRAADLARSIRDRRRVGLHARRDERRVGFVAQVLGCRWAGVGPWRRAFRVSWRFPARCRAEHPVLSCGQHVVAPRDSLPASWQV
jgi:hypothetical protein